MGHSVHLGDTWDNSSVSDLKFFVAVPGLVITLLL